MIIWITVIAIVVFAFVLDLSAFNHKPHEITIKEAGIRTFVWQLTRCFFRDNLSLFSK